MSYTQIKVETADRICTITLNRPDKLNAFTGSMGDELQDAFSAARNDPDVSVLILTGAGAAFCAGADMAALTDPEERKKLAATPFLSRFPLENLHGAKPTICAMNGAAIGVGITMALSFDIRIAAETAKLAVPFVKLGILPGLGSTYLLERLIGRGRCLDLLLSGRNLSGAEAKEIGLVDRTAAPGEVLNLARAYAQELVARDPFVVAAIKEAVNSGGDGTIEAAIQTEQRLMRELRGRKS